MNFDFECDQQQFLSEVETFLDGYHDPEAFDVTRENMSQLVDTPARRRLMKAIADRGWIGLAWPKEWGGQDKSGIYEYLLNEALAARGAPQAGKGVGIIGKTLLRHGNEMLKKQFLPKILRNEIEFALAYSEPDAGSDVASMRLQATRQDDGWLLNGQKTWISSAHFADWCWVGARTDPDAPKHYGITLFLTPMSQPGISVDPIWTMGDERTNIVSFNDVWVADDYVVGELNKGFTYISEALDAERFSMFTFSPIAQRVNELVEYVASATIDGRPLRHDPLTRHHLAQLVTQAEVARLLGYRVLDKSMKGGPAPTGEASEYKLYATELSKRLANVAMDIGSPGTQLRIGTSDAPMRGRADCTYRYTVLDTLGGGSSEVQKNIIARRKLGLPRNF